MSTEIEMSLSKPIAKPVKQANLRLMFLSQEQIVRIDEMLNTAGEYGEVHLIMRANLG